MTQKTRFPADRRQRSLLWVGSWVLLSAAAVHGQSVGQELKTRVETMRITSVLRLAGETVPASDVLATLYERRGFAPLWEDPARRAALRVALARVTDDGLDPATYHYASLVASGETNADPARAAHDDLLHTHALLLAAQHLRFGRVDAAALTPRRRIDRALFAADAVAAAEALLALEPMTALGTVRPQHFVYQGLAAALKRLQYIQRNGGWAQVPAGRLQRDSTSPRVVALRRRLSAEGDLAPGADTLSTIFDAELDAAVRSFQHRHGLNTDGVVGPVTLRELNVPLQTRIDQIRLNLERARWVVHDLPNTFVTVNVAGANVYFVRDGELLFESRAVVGRNATRTPIFSATLRYIDVNPTWTVPPGIVQEILNLVRRDPSYLRTHQMRVLDGNGRAVNAANIDFGRYTGRTFPYVFRQDAGPLNPLGRLKLVFPNSYNVYLHDTPARELFEREDRTFSHGCIRVADPVRLAELVLDDPAWNSAAIRAAITAQQTRSIPLRSPIPVLILYWTAAADLHGELHFYRDVYGRDDPLLRALDAS